METQKLDKLLTRNEQLIAQLEQIRAEAEHQTKELAQSSASQVDPIWLDATKQVWLDVTKEVDAIVAAQTEKLNALQTSIDEQA